MVSFNFLYPNFLWFTLLIPFFIFVYFFGLGYNKKRALMFSNFHALERFYGVEFFSKNFLALYFNMAVLALLIFSLAGFSLSFVASTSSFSYVMLIDNSKSMSSVDILPNRLDAAKESALTFVDSLPVGVGVGVVGFSGEALVYRDITTDKLLINSGISQVDYGLVQGTNIYNALLSAGQSFDRLGDSSKLKSVIIMSDGQVNVGEAPQVIAFAKKNNIIIHTIAVGTEEGGETDFNLMSKADVDFLKAISFETGGNYFSVTDTVDFESSFNSLVDSIEDEVTIDLSLYLLIVALLLFVIDWVFYNLRFRVYP
ncbi:MAG: Ca-activated chloride channel family protein [Patescibacteria group bacterium]|jgi:Ca-activated chloride channel family protein